MMCRSYALKVPSAYATRHTYSTMRSFCGMSKCSLMRDVNGSRSVAPFAVARASSAKSVAYSPTT